MAIVIKNTNLINNPLSKISKYPNITQNYTPALPRN